MAAKLQKVKAVKDDCGHWYVIPEELFEQFRWDDNNDEMSYSGLFDDKYGQYRTGGDLNLVQLFAEIN